MGEITEEGDGMEDDMFRDVNSVVILGIASSNAENSSIDRSTEIQIPLQIQAIKHFHKLILLIYNRSPPRPIIPLGISIVA